MIKFNVGSIPNRTSRSGISILTKDNSLILRGLAIMVIMLHNFLHNPKLGFTPENEMSFSENNVIQFFSKMDIAWFNPYEWLSFLGWTGVVVFVFLTGYGLSKNTPLTDISQTFSYVKRQYLKLLILLLPALVIFFIGDLMEHKMFPDILKRTSYLTMMANVVYPWVKCPPGVYWYFGLTFQFYMVYAFCGRLFKVRYFLGGG